VAGIIVADTIQSGGSFIRLNSASQTVATINASGIYANTGNLLIAANGTIGVASITNTAITGTMTQAQIGNNVAGTGPSFSAYLDTNQSISSGVYTKVQFNAELWDTNSCYSTSLYRFTPNVAGYYQFNLTYNFNPVPSNELVLVLYKNGSGTNFLWYTAGITSIYRTTASTMAYANGTTDYFEAYVYTANSTTFSASSVGTFFQGFLARAA
jgi:hypothetical protein